MFTGAVITQYHTQKHKKLTELFTSYTLSIIGTIIDKKEYNQQQKQQQFVIHVSKFHTTLNHTWRQLNTKILINTKNYSWLQIGDTIEIKNLTCAQVTTEKKFLMQHYGYRGTAFNVFDIILHNRPLWHFKNTIYTLKNRLSAKIKQKLNPQTYNLFSSLFLGKHEKSDSIDTYILFSPWGLNHYLARAGLHLLILFFILNILTSLIISRFFTKIFVNTGISVCYYALSYTNTPFMRALLVFLSYQCCHIFKTQIQTLHILNLILLGYLLLKPIDIFFLDFQLTFAITYTLLIIGSYTKFTRSI